MNVNALYETIKLEKSGKIATVILNRPKSLNAMNPQMMRELKNCLKEVEKDDDILVLVLRGEGKGFSSGGDIKEMLNLGGEQEFSEIMEVISELAMTLYTMKKLTITGIHGAAAGLGLSMALATDYIICEEDSKLAMNFIGIGLIPDGGGHFFLEERLGTGRAKKLMWTGKVIEGQEALMKKLVDEAIPSGKLDRAIEKYITECLQKPLMSIIESKSIYAQMNRDRLEKALELEKAGQWKMRQTHDHQEGIRAFVEKRVPQFKGK
ncbi:enoyl-CoA hydratase [Rossellomorea vietnamensis]|uniref:Enoyl-CoA hydratase n=1 Tax=Rossellomorea vietnamensis TaxID=218284 RepID=A0A5D4NMY9_9BACI|nr:enoyl-CoA hydratase [Rossellomorea vietnamensis]TYS15497.1 enoyl-CoA hydratase [Rossellomorea vietnamensis]